VLTVRHEVVLTVSHEVVQVCHGGVHLEYLLLHNVLKTCEGREWRDNGCRLLKVRRLGVAARRSDSLHAVVW
jgi:hypothetical protein